MTILPWENKNIEQEEENPYLKLKKVVTPALETAKTMVTQPWGNIEAGANLFSQLYGLPAMKASVIKEGLPLFQLAPPVIGGAGLLGEKLTRKENKE